MKPNGNQDKWAFYEVEDSRKFPISTLVEMREDMDSAPSYQRQSGVWDEPKQRFLIDTILNRFVIPPIYLHEYLTPKSGEKNPKRYAVVDGKQRLEAIWAFADGRLSLADDFRLYANPAVVLSGMTYREIALSHPELSARFDNSKLAVTVVKTADLDVIEELFLRLNEASPLNAAEKRNAFGGHLVPRIKELAAHGFFEETVPYENRRYRYLEQAAKFLLMEDRGQACDLKKTYLDALVRSFTTKGERGADDAMRLFSRTSETLDQMANFFEAKDPLLKVIGANSVYFLLFLSMKRGEWKGVHFSREALADFEAVRTLNQLRASQDMKTANYRLVEYDQYTQSNDEGSFRVRASVIRDFLENYRKSDHGKAFLLADRIDSRSS